MFTPYWAWYCQRLQRWWHGHRLPSPHIIRHLDAQSAVYCDPQRLLRPSWCDCMIVDPQLVTHLPHEVSVLNQNRMRIHEPSDQEIWCEMHVGIRDRDWLYQGRHKWRFRLEEQASHFQLVWS